MVHFMKASSLKADLMALDVLPLVRMIRHFHLKEISRIICTMEMEQCCLKMEQVMWGDTGRTRGTVMGTWSVHAPRCTKAILKMTNSVALEISNFQLMKPETDYHTLEDTKRMYPLEMEP